MNFGFRWMIQGWSLKSLLQLITNSPIPKPKHEALLRHGNWQHPGSLPYFHETGRVSRPGGSRGNWVGRGKHSSDVHSRASERNRGNALDRISLVGDLESACQRIVDGCFIGRSDWLRGGVWIVQSFRAQR